MINKYYFVIVKYNQVIAKVELESDHPHKQDFINYAKKGLSLIYKVREDQIYIDPAG